MNQKGFTSLIVSVIVAVLLLGGGYLLIKNKDAIPDNAGTKTLEEDVIQKNNEFQSETNFSIHSLSREIAISGEELTVYGTLQFPLGENYVHFDGGTLGSQVVKNVITISNTSQDFIVPKLKAGSYRVYVNNKDGTTNSLILKIVEPNPTSSIIEVTAPRKNDQWQIGENYFVKWRGGEGKISIFLQDKSRESSSDVLKGNIWHARDLGNTGSYIFSVGNDFSSIKGPFRFYIKDEKGNSAFSEYFTVIK